MPRAYTADQYDRLTRKETRPIVLVRLEYGSPLERLSCSGEVTFDGEVYTAGGANLKRLQGGRAALIDIRATSERVGIVEESLWIGGLCQIYYIPGLPSETPTYTLQQGFLLVDGIIDGATLSDDRIQVNVINKYLKGQMSPVLHLSTICNHVPAAGSITEWEGEKLSNGSATDAILQNFISEYGDERGRYWYQQYLAQWN